MVEKADKTYIVLKEFQLFVVGFLIVTVMMLYTNTHEYVHRSSCVYYGGIWNRTSFNGGTCTINDHNLIAGLDTINEMIASVINIVIFLTLIIFTIYWFDDLIKKVVKWREKNLRKSSQSILES